jgi:ribonuclease P protein component
VCLLRSSEFRQVYDRGTRHTCACFAAFFLANGGLGRKVGFTTPRALGTAVLRNRIRRRIREAVRLELEFLSPEWSIVFNPRRRSLDCPFPELRAEVNRLFRRCPAALSSRQLQAESSEPSASTNA